jgi:hypothetical protein
MLNKKHCNIDLGCLNDKQYDVTRKQNKNSINP